MNSNIQVVGTAEKKTTAAVNGAPAVQPQADEYAKYFGPNPSGTNVLVLPPFPPQAWRGYFETYRAIMAPTTEASDVAHFATFWGICAANLCRNVQMFSGDVLYPNVYISLFGPSGDRKTTAQRRAIRYNLLVHSNLRTVKDVGSTEGLADALAVSPTNLDDTEEETPKATEVPEDLPMPILFFWEELSALLTRGRWSGSTLFEFLTQIYDCPPVWALKYRKKPVSLKEPTPTILCGTTPEWFWKHARAEDFFGGFGNRILFLTGTRKPPIPEPPAPNEEELFRINKKLVRLTVMEPCVAKFSDKASALWKQFYLEWENTKRDALLGAALKRIPNYVQKLAMVYAALEQKPGSDPKKLPQLLILHQHLEAAIAVGRYAEACTRSLLEARVSAKATEEMQLEDRFVKWIRDHPDQKLRRMQMSLSRYCGSSERFNRFVKSLELAGRISISPERTVSLGAD